MRNLIATFIAILSVTTAIAQPFVDVVNVQVQQFGFNEKSTTEYTGNIFLPLELKSGSVVIIGASGNQLSFDNGNDLPKTNLSAISLQLGGIKKWNDEWSTMALAIPKISSDFKDITIKDYQMGGAGLMIKTVNEDFKYKFGLYYNREFFGNFFMPLFGFEWKATEKFKIFGVLPGNMNIEHKLSDKFYTGISYKSITTSFRISGFDDKLYVRDGHKFWGHNQLKGFINYYPVKGLALYSEVGHTAFRQFNEYESGKKEQLSSLNGFKDNLFINIGASIRVRLDNKN